MTIWVGGCGSGGGGGGGGSSIEEIEIDFGSVIPQREASFLIIDGLVTPTTRIVAWESADTALGRVGVDQEWDQLILAARAAAGSFTLYVTAVPGPVLGRRVIFYQRG